MTSLCVCTYIYVFIVLHLKMMSSYYTPSYTQCLKVPSVLPFHFLPLICSVTPLLSVTNLQAHDCLRGDTSRRGNCVAQPLGTHAPERGREGKRTLKTSLGEKQGKDSVCWLGSLGSWLQEVNFDFIAHTLLLGRRK